MKKELSIIFLAIIALIVFSAQPQVFAATITDYCQAPPYINAIVPPNVLMLIDVSGSMACTAYRQATDRQRYCSGNTNVECDPDHTTDCVRNFGTCSVGSGSNKHCSGDTDRHCHKDSDCTRNWGTCTFSNSSLIYGTCSNNDLLGCSVNADCGVGNTCDPRQVYEGYFTPEKYYELNADGIYYENTTYVPTGNPCVIYYTYTCGSKSTSCTGATLTAPADALNSPAPCSTSKKYYCPNSKGTPTTQSGDCGAGVTGNWLNFMNMSRIDLLRWAITGGVPSSCGTGAGQGVTYAYCDPRVYLDASAAGKVGAVCSDTLPLNSAGTVTGHGCILKNAGNSGDSWCPSGTSTSPVSVAVPWSRIEQGLAFQFATLPVKPRLGGMFFGLPSSGSGDSILSNYSIYVGDFTAAQSRSNYDYQNLITNVDTATPLVYTPTGPAMWDAKHYLSQTTPQYGGIQATDNSHWKSPMYDCDVKDTGGGAGASCTFNTCTKNFVMLLSDGLWNKPSCSIDTGLATDASSDPVVAAYKMHMGFTNAVTNVATSVNSVYTVGVFVNTEGEKALQNTAIYGSFDTTGGRLWPSNKTGYPTTSCATTDPGCSGTSKGSSCTALPTSSTDWDKNADNVPDNYYSADDALTIRNKLMDAVLDMLTRVSSGTAASVLASGEGSGATLLQALFYPRKQFDSTSETLSWVSTLQAYWYYLDPKLNSSSIREDSSSGGTSDNLLQLEYDNITQFFFDAGEQRTKAYRWASLADGTKSTQLTTVYLENLQSLWEAGRQLWNTSAASRTIFTNCGINTSSCITSPVTTCNPLSATTCLMDFSTVNLDGASQYPYLDVASAAEADAIVNYARGEDNTATGQRIRATAIDLNGTNGAIDTNVDTGKGIMDETSKVWKLGDVISSTPKIVSWIPLHKFDETYQDATYNQFVNSTGYKKRGTVFIGSNDGMLHAFRLGLLGVVEDGTSHKATLCYDANNNGTCDSGETSGTNLANLGKEQWAFVPKNVLPYLKYLTDPDYCHLYYVDATPVIFDASINKDSGATNPAGCTDTDYWKCAKTVNSWRTILIGGMRTGGACKSTATTDGVTLPAAGKGYSSYFALDITDSVNHPNEAVSSYPPKLLWEFSRDDLGFSTTGPAIVRINSRTTTGTVDKTMNGKWFVVFASGPTGPIDTASNQFKGHSDQNLKLFILDLKTGAPASPCVAGDDGTGVGCPDIDTGITNAFGGSLNNTTIDYDLDYQDDALYMGYTSKCEVSTNAFGTTTSTTSGCTDWTQGGVIRLLTRANLTGIEPSTPPNSYSDSNTGLNPKKWVGSYVAKDIGSVTSAIARLAHYPMNATNPDAGYLFFGTGRYFFKTSVFDDASSRRAIFGIKEPCLAKIKNIKNLADPTCNNTAMFPDFAATCAGSTAGCYNLDGTSRDVVTNINPANATTLNSCLCDATTSGASSATTYGWYILLDDTSTSSLPERNITDPLATPNGSIFFTTYAPTNDLCKFGGSSYLWAVNYSTGGSVASLLTGKALLQVSTGAIEEITKSSFDNLDSKGQRRSAAMQGVPPAGQGLSIVQNPLPLNKMLHLIKK